MSLPLFLPPQHFRAHKKSEASKRYQFGRPCCCFTSPQESQRRIQSGNGHRGGVLRCHQVLQLQRGWQRLLAEGHPEGQGLRERRQDSAGDQDHEDAEERQRDGCGRLLGDQQRTLHGHGAYPGETFCGRSMNTV